MAYDPTLQQLRRRASKHCLLIRKYERGEDSWMVQDYDRFVVSPYPLTLEQVAEWLDWYESDEEEEAAAN